MTGKAYPPFACTATPQLPELLLKLRCSIAITTFQAGKLVFLSPKNENEIVQLPRSFEKPMGLAIEGDKLALACKNQLILFKGSAGLARGYPKKPQVYDTIFVPTSTHYTGQVDLHDISWTSTGLVAVNTSFSCLVKMAPDFSFIPVWQPSFISGLASEDRCHLNGMACENGGVKYVTALGMGDTKQSWKQAIPKGGVIIDVESDAVMATDLPMPHSPRIVSGKLYVLYSALGQLVTIDPQDGRSEVIYQQDGFARGLAIYGDYLFVGYSKLRENSSTFGKLEFSKKAVHCGITVIHEPTGAFVGELRYHSSVDEIYDIQVLGEYVRPNILNTTTDEFKSALITPKNSYWGHSTEDTFKKRA